MKRGIFGPWIGEFGWELMSWQGYVRSRAREFDEVYVCGPRGSEALYHDFVTSYIPYDSAAGIPNCWHRDNENRIELLNLELGLQRRGTLIKPFRLIRGDQQEFIPFGKRCKSLEFDVVVHARKPIGKHPEHAYSQEDWDVLVTTLTLQGLKVAAMGSAAFLPASAVDLRGDDLFQTMDLLASSKFMAGPASGPTLLSLLCKTPVLVWTDKRWWSAVRGTDRERIETIWNPFGTASVILDQVGWNAEPSVLLKGFKKAGDRWL